MRVGEEQWDNRKVGKEKKKKKKEGRRGKKKNGGRRKAHGTQVSKTRVPRGFLIHLSSAST